MSDRINEGANKAHARMQRVRKTTRWPSKLLDSKMTPGLQQSYVRELENAANVLELHAYECDLQERTVQYLLKVSAAIVRRLSRQERSTQSSVQRRRLERP
jgi:hypothetical protein